MNTWNGYIYTGTQNVHKTFVMFVTYIHRTQESWNTKSTYDFLVQVRNFLLPLSLKVLRHKERDTHSFYSGFFICTPISCDTCPRPPRASESQPSSPEAGLNSTNFLQNLRNPPRASGAWRHPHHLGLLWHLWVTRPLRFAPRVREHLR